METSVPRGSKSRIKLMAPLSGVLVPLESLPDPVFAQKMVGDGVSVDPTSQTLLSPCPGTIFQIHGAFHALTVKMENGLEVMIHIGLETVQLKGAGFTPRVKAGDRVSTGDPLIEFDAGLVAEKAKSLLTQIVITTPDLVRAMVAEKGEVRAGSDPVLVLDLQEAPEHGTGKPEGGVCTETIVILNSSGLHARPAATLTSLARRFSSEIRLHLGDKHANARSVSSIMALNVKRGDKVTLWASGPDADEAVKTIGAQFREGLGEAVSGGGAPGDPVGKTVPTSKSVAVSSQDPNLLTGVGASPGLAYGQISLIRRRELAFSETGETPMAERKRLGDAVEGARTGLSTMQARLTAAGDPDKAAIFGAHLELLEDPDLMLLAESAIEKGKSAPAAWHGAFTALAERLAALPNELLAARANDLRDVGRRVLEILVGVEETAPEFPENCLVFAEELAPSDVMNFDRRKVQGFCSVSGGTTSHVSILARSLGFPAVVGVQPRALEIPAGTWAILDGGRGTIRLNPDQAELKNLKSRLDQRETVRKENLKNALNPAVTVDGHKVEVVANTGGPGDSEEALKLGAEGVGLLRSEFLFLDRATPPDEREQTESYLAATRPMGREKPVIIRTLDVGGDKPLSYLPIPKEENPFLGERGIRVCLDRPEILRTQVRAILKAASAGNVHIMFPMISSLDEWRAAREIVREEAKALGVKPVPMGIMVEIPSAALLAASFAPEVDFFSIGTNDLTQYTLAMDRGHPKLASKIDALHPGLLKLIAMVVDAAHAQNKFVGVCGGLASDLNGVPLLVGLGVDELSVSIPAIPGVKAAIRKLSFAACQNIAREALGKSTAAEVRALIPPDPAE